MAGFGKAMYGLVSSVLVRYGLARLGLYGWVRHSGARLGFVGYGMVWLG